LKGGSRAVGAVHVAELCAELEAAGKRHAVSEGSALVAGVQAELERALNALRNAALDSAC
jgi:HPt (histidine-containing phosphotransfer) domain-containing protein